MGCVTKVLRAERRADEYRVAHAAPLGTGLDLRSAIQDARAGAQQTGENECSDQETTHLG